jgi:hypothetical protein
MRRASAGFPEVAGIPLDLRVTTSGSTSRCPHSVLTYMPMIIALIVGHVRNSQEEATNGIGQSAWNSTRLSDRWSELVYTHVRCVFVQALKMVRLYRRVTLCYLYVGNIHGICYLTYTTAK